ncbi:MAG: DUF2782 domain-containing protein [Pseudomonadales bacterium]|jgi:hypothetical protein|nr:DUF2782 domain-containing protein [Pseudomonadales bacterium]
MRSKAHHTSNIRYFPWITWLLTCLLAIGLIAPVSTVAEEREEDDIQIVEGEDRIIYEYRQNGILTMIKVVPKQGRPYYMVPADGAPHYESLDHKRQLYPQWVIVEF